MERYVGESERSRERRVRLAVARREKEGKEAEVVGRGLVRGKGSEKVGGGGMDSLAAMIQQRQKERAATGGLFEGLEAKYAPPSKKSARKKKRGSPVVEADEDDEPSEEAFARNRALGKEAGDSVSGGAAGGRRKRVKRG